MAAGVVLACQTREDKLGSHEMATTLPANPVLSALTVQGHLHATVHVRLRRHAGGEAPRLAGH